MRTHRSLVVVIVAGGALSLSGWTGRAQSTTPASRPAPKSSAAKPVPRLPDGHPDLQGVWSTATVTPFERPREFADKEFMTEAEAAAFEKATVARLNVDQRLGKGTDADVTLAYNDAWWDRGTRVVPTRRTSLIVDPPEGKMPALTEAGRKHAAAVLPYSGHQDGRNLDSWFDRGLWERCITRGMPDVMLPTAYNNNFQIFQSSDSVGIVAEMIHDARIIPLDGRPHSHIRQWMGDSRGHWEGDTLVVDTTNFTDQTSFRGSGANLHMVERFQRIDADTLDYRLTVDDPTTFVRPWTIDLPSRKMAGVMYEYACHEGNYAMTHALLGSRVKEAEEAAKKKN